MDSGRAECQVISANTAAAEMRPIIIVLSESRQPLPYIVSQTVL